MEIVITEQAEIKLREIVFYLKFEFGNVVAKSFLDKFEHHISLIKKEFTIGKKENNSYYSLLIIKQIRVYYKIIENTIYILTFFDTRQNPKKLKQILP